MEFWAKGLTHMRSVQSMALVSRCVPSGDTAMPVMRGLHSSTFCEHFCWIYSSTLGAFIDRRLKLS